MADLSTSFNPAWIATTSDVASKATDQAATNSNVASEASSAIAARTDQSVKSAASPQFVDVKATQHIYFDACQTATGDGTTTIDWGLGNKFYFTFGAFSETFTFTAPDGPCNVVLVLKQDGTGSRLVTEWPETVMWPDGTEPTLSTGAAAIDIVCFFYDGTNYFGQTSLDFSVPV